MGKADKQTARNMNWDTRTSDTAQGNQGIDYTTNRSKTLDPATDYLRGNASNISMSMANPTGPGAPSYVKTFNDIQAPNAGLDWSGVDSGSGRLMDTSGNYGATNNSITGLTDFAKTGGVSAADQAKIDQPVFNEFAATGGYTPQDLANIRARGNSGIASTYQNAQDQLNRTAAASGQFGPGYSSAGFKLLRQGAQDIGTNAQTTEANIADAVRQGRMAGAQAIAGNTLAELPIKSGNTLQGYNSAAGLEQGKNAQVNSATQNAISDLLNKSGIINQSRLSAAGGNLQGQTAGLQGLLNTYGTTANEQNANNNLLYNYRRGLANDLNQTTNNQLAVNSAPGIMSDIGGAIGLAGAVAPIFGGIGNSGFTGGRVTPAQMGYSPANMSQYSMPGIWG